MKKKYNLFETDLIPSKGLCKYQVYVLRGMGSVVS